MCSMKFEYENEIWRWEWNVQWNLNMRMKFEGGNEIFNTIGLIKIGYNKFEQK